VAGLEVGGKERSSKVSYPIKCEALVTIAFVIVVKRTTQRRNPFTAGVIMTFDVYVRSTPNYSAQQVPYPTDGSTP
ncbi:hypothetical protein THRCLA_21375, partial [Thraustotheca clavata]